MVGWELVEDEGRALMEPAMNEGSECGKSIPRWVNYVGNG